MANYWLLLVILTAINNWFSLIDITWITVRLLLQRASWYTSAGQEFSIKEQISSPSFSLLPAQPAFLAKLVSDWPFIPLKRINYSFKDKKKNFILQELPMQHQRHIDKGAANTTTAGEGWRAIHVIYVELLYPPLLTEKLWRQFRMGMTRRWSLILTTTFKGIWCRLIPKRLSYLRWHKKEMRR